MNSAITIREIRYKESSLKYNWPKHTHSFHQWFYLVYGNVVYNIDGAEYILNPEESIVIPPHAVRAPRCLNKAPGYIIADFKSILDLSPMETRVIKTPKILKEELRELIKELIETMRIYSEEYLSASFQKMIIDLLRHVKKEVDGNKRQPINLTYYEEISAAVETFMQRNRYRSLHQNDIAQAVHLSSPHLARIFKATTGKTLIERFSEIRIEYAKELLLSSSLPITHIALEVGYSSFSHFSKLFKTMVGISPSKYRQNKGHVWQKI